MKTTIFLGLLFLSGAVAAQMSADIWLYHVPISYSDESYRQDGKISGLYGALRTDSGYVWEGAVEKTLLQYKAWSDFDQTDVTLSLTYHRQSSQAYRFGVHGIYSDNENTDKGFTLFAGFHGYHPYEDSYGGTLYYTRYPNTDLQVWQAVPSVGKYLGNPILTGTFLLEGKLYLIAANKENSYFSVEGKVSWFYEAFNLSLGAWGGSQSYAVRNDGFTVYNLPEKHKAGINFQAGYAITDSTHITLGVAQERVAEKISEANVDITTYSLVLKQTF